MEAETISRILNKLASSSGNALYHDEIFSSYRDRLISACSEELRLIRQRATNLGKNDGTESRAAVVLQRIMETMMVTEIDRKLSEKDDEAWNPEIPSHSFLRPSQLVFDRKCIPTINDLARCIHVKPRSLEALKKSLQFYFSDSHKQTLKTSSGNHSEANKGSEKIIQKLVIRLVSMLDFDYDAQQTVMSASKLYKEVVHFKLYGTQEAQRLRSATEYDMDKFLPYYCASCCFIILLGNFKQQVDTYKRTKNYNRNEKHKTSAKKQKEKEKEFVQQVQNSILQNEGLSIETFENILQHVQNIILEIQKRNTTSSTEEKMKKTTVYDKRLSESRNSDGSKLLNNLHHQVDQQTRENTHVDGMSSQQPSTVSDRISDLERICGKAESDHAHDSDAFQQWKKRTLENYMSDIATEISHTEHWAPNEVDDKIRDRRLKKLAADKVLGIHGYIQSN
jgi:hypothetical protein